MATAERPIRAEDRMVEGARRVLVPALVAAAIGLVGTGLGLITDPDRTLFAYLAAWAFALSTALGALFLVMIAHVVHVKWFIIVRRLAETVMAALPVLALLALPVLLGADRLYPWVPPLPPEMPEHERVLLARKEPYLNLTFFWIRAVVYLAVWIGLAELLRRWSYRQDRDPAAADVEVPVKLSAAGLVALALTMSFAAFDWIMSLSPTWVSTIFGVYWFAGGVVAALGLLTVLTRSFERAGALRALVAEGHYYALGRLLLTFTIFWAYIAFSQGWLMWIANLPREVTWYLDRWAAGWDLVLIGLAIGHFLLPFAALLSYGLKQDGGKLAVVAGWIVAMHYVDSYWLTVPASPGGLVPHWTDLATLLLVCGGAAAFAAWRIAGGPALPIRDPRLEESVMYRRGTE